NKKGRKRFIFIFPFRNLSHMAPRASLYSMDLRLNITSVVQFYNIALRDEQNTKTHGQRAD
ncbi:MAG: hypothetical protein IJP65_08705, partial [Bacteroidales bacterium]|nr:hypothetical protein [Bacteroidales bacterium]